MKSRDRRPRLCTAWCATGLSRFVEKQLLNRLANRKRAIFRISGDLPPKGFYDLLNILELYSDSVGPAFDCSSTVP